MFLNEVGCPIVGFVKRSFHQLAQSTEAPAAPKEDSTVLRFHHPAQAVVHHKDVRPASLRVALYSHDTMGLGHARRNLLIAQTLAKSSYQAAILMLTGTRQATAFAMPRGVDCLTLPALRKEADGQYCSRRLDVTLPELIALRAKTIRAALEEFAPDVLIVDKVPRGAVGELDPTLEYLRRHGRTKCVLGLRDVLDDPAVVRREWQQMANEDAIRNYYDAVWVYGDPAVYDLARECRFPFEVAHKVRYTGYFDQRQRLELANSEDTEADADAQLRSKRLVLCLLGGGQDGMCLGEAFAQVDLPPQTTGLILTGPFMPPALRQRLRQLAAANPYIQVLEFVTEPGLLLRRADRVIAMGGYNTVCEVLSYEKRALIIPRARPRREQLIRAERLRGMGLLDMLDPDSLNPRALSKWLAREAGPPSRVRDRIDLNGLANLPRLLEEVLAARSIRSLPHEVGIRKAAR